MKAFRKGTHVGIWYTDARGRKVVTQRWWNQVEAFVTKAARAGGTDFKVRRRGSDLWEPYEVAPNTAELAVGPFYVEVASRQDDSGEWFVELSGVDCSLEGEAPGIYYPVKS